MNFLIIELNNYAVHELKQGQLEKAYELLTYACEKTMAKHHNHIDTPHQTFRYAWEDCTKALTKRLHEGCMPFMYLKFLTITTPMGRASVEGLCPCGFAWVLWYNLGIVSALMAESTFGRGNMLLKQSLTLLQRVQSRVDPEPLSKHWSMLQLSVLNNQACVLSDLSMNDQILDRLVKMGLTLTKASTVLDPADHELFHWTVQKLVEEKYAAAA